MEKERKNKIKKAGVISGIVVALVFGAFGYSVFLTEENLETLYDDGSSWYVIGELSSYDYMLGENDPGDATSGWLSTFCLDYDATPTTALANNASYDEWDNVSGFVDADNTDTDLASDDPFYFVVRCRFNDTVKDGSDFIGSRTRCILTVSGDETIGGVAHTGDSTGVSGGGVVSQNGSNYIYVNFYWDDNDDGYRITDDGSLAWNITVEAKY